VGIAAIILAAGASSRMGSPKALLSLHDETFVSRLIRVFAEFCSPVIVVVGYHAEAIREHVNLLPRPPIVVVNPAPENGQLSSLQTALRAVPADAGGFLFVPVDCPSVRTDTARRVVAALAARMPQTEFVVPSFQGRHGHPVGATMTIARKLLALPPTASAREVVHAHRAQTSYIDIEDAGILADIDDPAAYRRLKEAAQK
jgi:molybdenum cofactor cytidylyltransferase